MRHLSAYVYFRISTVSYPEKAKTMQSFDFHGFSFLDIVYCDPAGKGLEHLCVRFEENSGFRKVYSR